MAALSWTFGDHRGAEISLGPRPPAPLGTAPVQQKPDVLLARRLCKFYSKVDTLENAWSNTVLILELNIDYHNYDNAWLAYWFQPGLYFVFVVLLGKFSLVTLCHFMVNGAKKVLAQGGKGQNQILPTIYSSAIR